MDKNEVITYYDKIAKEYDKSRFDNSYGSFIHKQEVSFFNKYIGKEYIESHLDIGCGTGRFMEYAHHGIDPSKEMIAIAQEKFPNKIFKTALGSETGYKNESFDTVFSFHVMMHLDKKVIEENLNEAHRILKKDGQLIFDFPSHKRRKLINYRTANWHGATSLSIEDIKTMAGNKFRLKYYQGFLFLPIHKFPIRMRKWFYHLDQLLCKSFLKSYSSYIVLILEKND